MNLETKTKLSEQQRGAQTKGVFIIYGYGFVGKIIGGGKKVQGVEIGGGHESLESVAGGS